MTHIEKQTKKQTRYVYVEIIVIRYKSHVYVQKGMNLQQISSNKQKF